MTHGLLARAGQFWTAPGRGGCRKPSRLTVCIFVSPLDINSRGGRECFEAAEFTRSLEDQDSTGKSISTGRGAMSELLLAAHTAGVKRHGGGIEAVVCG